MRRKHILDPAENIRKYLMLALAQQQTIKKQEIRSKKETGRATNSAEEW